jgi:hypothetical protein
VLAGQSSIEAALHQLLARAGDGVDAGIQCFGDLAVAPGSARLQASAFSRMRAFSTCRAGLVPFCISALRRSRSSALSVTMYLFTAGCFAITTHLQVTGDIDSEIGRRINDAGH